MSNREMFTYYVYRFKSSPIRILACCRGTNPYYAQIESHRVICGGLNTVNRAEQTVTISHVLKFV